MFEVSCISFTIQVIPTVIIQINLVELAAINAIVIISGMKGAVPATVSLKMTSSVDLCSNIIILDTRYIPGWPQV